MTALSPSDRQELDRLLDDVVECHLRMLGAQLSAVLPALAPIYQEAREAIHAFLSREAAQGENGRETIVAMRAAIEVLKAKWSEGQGAWAVVDFVGAASDPGHWMQTVVRAEILSQAIWEAHQLAAQPVPAVPPDAAEGGEK